ncbi:MAG: response regulator transcription factor [Alphaproteobacteria bacterium]|nr:response regulator transcription factor [Alphaproteobacteria bacterium]
MANILFVSKSDNFAHDIEEQLKLYTEGFSIFDEWNEDIIFDMAVVDDDIDSVKELQKRIRKSPIIFLGNTDDDLGDSVTVISKPFRLEYFLDMVLSCSNLFAHSSDGQLMFDKYILDSGKKELYNTSSNSHTKLTEREVSIIKYLYKAHEKVVSKNELLSEVWGYNPEATTHTVETHIYRLRQKIEEENPDDNIIITEDNGYRLNF